MTVTVLLLALGMSNAYLLENEHGLYLVDAGPPSAGKRIMREIDRIGKPLRLIFITHAHFDHYGAAAAVQRVCGTPVAIHPADASAIASGCTPLGTARGRGRLAQALQPLVSRLLPTEPVNADLLLEDSQHLDEYGLDAVLLHTPGHTPGSSCLLVENRLSFVGDLLSSNGRPHAQELFADDWSRLPASLARLQNAQPEWVFTGHGRRPISGDALREMHC